MKVAFKAKYKDISKMVWVEEEEYPDVIKHKWRLIPRNGGSNPDAPFQVATDINRKTIYLHRFLMVLEAGDKRQVDHIDRDPLNNCRSNLRIVTHGVNQRNRTARICKTTSRFPGVCWNKQNVKWKAQISMNGKYKHLGYYMLEEVAAKVYRTEALKIDPLLNHKVWEELL